MGLVWIPIEDGGGSSRPRVGADQGCFVTVCHGQSESSPVPTGGALVSCLGNLARHKLVVFSSSSSCGTCCFRYGLATDTPPLPLNPQPPSISVTPPDCPPVHHPAVALGWFWLCWEIAAGPELSRVESLSRHCRQRCRTCRLLLALTARKMQEPCMSVFFYY